MVIYDAKVNHLRNPLGFRMERTVFSWKVREAAGKKQQAARICVSLDAAGEQVILDTGMQEQADSLGWDVEVVLQPRTRYYWMVEVQDETGDSAVSETQWFETGKREEPWQAHWITCDNGEPRHPYFERKITGKESVAQARLYICGLGLYEAFYNGARIGEEYLTPYCNDYAEWVQYQTYDVTEQLQESGTLSVLLGNGWYKARFGFSSREEKGYYGNEWKLLAELRITYADGTEEVIGTDTDWTVRRSQITYSSLYDGEHVDATLPELPVERAVSCDAPEGALTDRMSLPVLIQEQITPVELIHTPAGELVLDLGQEFSGIFRLRVHVPAGQVVHIQTGEILQQGNFYNANLRTAKSEYFYTSDGNETVLEPHFTYFGYRYVKVEGVPDLKCEDFTGLALYSAVEQKGSIRTGHELVNKFLSNVYWGLKGNFIDVPTDCPQRDERMGWTADTQVFVPTASYLTDSYAFYAKYLYDLKKDQMSLGGKVPDVVPDFGVQTTSSVWGDAACIIPWTLYTFYGDVSILKDQYDSMKAWVDYIRRVDGDDHGWRYVFHYGDWLALDNPAGGAEQVMGGTDEEFIANVYYAASAELVAKAAEVLGYMEDAAEYRKLSEEQFAEVKKEYYSETGRCCIKTQTAQLLTLKYHLSDNEELVRRHLEDLFVKSGCRLRTGFTGTPLLCNVLTDFGYSDLAYRLLLNEEFPGWLREVKLGATTVWERWNSLLDDGTISGISMNSMNHYAYGSVAEWVFRHAAGLNFRDGVIGCREAEFAPIPNAKLGEAWAEYDSPAGLYRCGWKAEDDWHVMVRVSVPFGASARLTLPLAGETVFADKENPMFAQVEDGVCILQPGDYEVTYETFERVRKQYSVDSKVRDLLLAPELRETLEEALSVRELPKKYGDETLRESLEKHPVRKFGDLDELDEKLKAF